jgi:hypothetical protein
MQAGATSAGGLAGQFQFSGLLVKKPPVDTQQKLLHNLVSLLLTQQQTQRRQRGSG